MLTRRVPAAPRCSASARHRANKNARLLREHEHPLCTVPDDAGDVRDETSPPARPEQVAGSAAPKPPVGTEVRALPALLGAPRDGRPPSGDHPDQDAGAALRPHPAPADAVLLTAGIPVEPLGMWEIDDRRYQAA
jgi:hypothetical protein